MADRHIYYWYVYDHGKYLTEKYFNDIYFYEESFSVPYICQPLLKYEA
jgi:hypothetical protein